MSNEPFVDYYEIFEASPNVGSETVERLFRHLAKQLHPDVANTGDVQRFSVLVEAYHTLKNPELRAAYDAKYEAEKRKNNELIDEAKHVDEDSAQRHHLLSLLYAQRRRDMRNPGVPASTLERLVGCPAEVVNFHLWYFREKNWVQREESGLLSITAEGVDKIEQISEAKANSSIARLTVQDKSVDQKPAGRSSPQPVHA